MYSYVSSSSCYQELGERITRLREEKEPPVKAVELAQMAGCSRFALYRIERGKVRADAKIICAIATALGVEVDELLEPAKWQLVRRARREREEKARRNWHDARRAS